MTDKLNKVVAESINQHRKRRSLVFLEASIGDLIDNYGTKETINILRSYIDFLEEF